MELPGEIVAAVMTRRAELLQPLRNRIKSGQPLDQKDSDVLLDLVRDAIMEAQADDQRRRSLITGVKELRASLKGVITQLDNMVRAFDGRPIEEDDD